MFYQVHVLIVSTSDTRSHKEYSDNEYHKIYKNFDDFFKNNSKCVNCVNVFPIFLSAPIFRAEIWRISYFRQETLSPGFQE